MRVFFWFRSRKHFPSIEFDLVYSRSRAASKSSVFLVSFLICLTRLFGYSPIWCDLVVVIYQKLLVLCVFRVLRVMLLVIVVYGIRYRCRYSAFCFEFNCHKHTIPPLETNGRFTCCSMLFAQTYENYKEITAKKQMAKLQIKCVLFGINSQCKWSGFQLDARILFFSCGIEIFCLTDYYNNRCRFDWFYRLIWISVDCQWILLSSLSVGGCGNCARTSKQSAKRLRRSFQFFAHQNTRIKYQCKYHHISLLWRIAHMRIFTVYFMAYHHKNARNMSIDEWGRKKHPGCWERAYTFTPHT